MVYLINYFEVRYLLLKLFFENLLVQNILLYLARVINPPEIERNLAILLVRGN